MGLHRNQHRNSAFVTDWQRLGLGLVVVLLMSLQGAAAMAHRHAHSQEFELDRPALTAPADSESPLPGNPAPAAQCKLCHSSIGAVSVLPAAETALASPLTVSGAAQPALHIDSPPAAPPAVWRVRGPPSYLHA